MEIVVGYKHQIDLDSTELDFTDQFESKFLSLNHELRRVPRKHTFDNCVCFHGCGQ